MKLKYRKGVFLVVYTKEKAGRRQEAKNDRIEYLLMHRILHWKGWEFPKGGIEKGETSKAAIKRELKEETGLNPSKIIDMHIKGKFNYPRKLADLPGIKGMEWKLFAVEIKNTNKRIRIDKKEHDSHKWLSFKEAYKKLKFANKKRCLAIVDKYVKN